MLSNGSLPLSLTKASVLCVIDFSDASTEALKSAIFLARQFKSRLTVLYPYRLNLIQADGIAQTKTNIDQAANERFGKLAEAWLKSSGITCEFRPEVGFFNDRIHAYCKKNTIGMLIISKRLVTSNKEGFMDVMDHLQVPLLIVPQNLIVSS